MARLDGARGFTLMEVLIVIILLMILAGVGLAPDTTSTQRAREATRKEDQFYADKNNYPSSLQDLVSERYLREVPKDPMTDSADTWRTISAEPDPNDPGPEPGIYDVKSGVGPDRDGWDEVRRLVVIIRPPLGRIRA